MGTAVISHHEYQPIPVMVKPSRPKVNFVKAQYTNETDFLKSYISDLRNGRPVKNISPSNDPYFLVPENIEGLISGISEMNQGNFRNIDPDTLFD